VKGARQRRDGYGDACEVLTRTHPRRAPLSPKVEKTPREARFWGVGLVISHLSASGMRRSPDGFPVKGARSAGVVAGLLTQPRQCRGCFHSLFEFAWVVSSGTPVFPTRARQNRALTDKGDGSAGLVSSPPPPGSITSLTVGLLPAYCRDTPYLATRSRQSTLVGAKAWVAHLRWWPPLPLLPRPPQGGLGNGNPSRTSACGYLIVAVCRRAHFGGTRGTYHTWQQDRPQPTGQLI